jgi:RNase P subunit RPR2
MNNRICKKCGGKYITIKHTTFYYNEIFKEWLEVKCLTCGYRWTTPTMDRKN